MSSDDNSPTEIFWSQWSKNNDDYKVAILELWSLDRLQIPKATFAQCLLGKVASLFAESVFMLLFGTHSKLYGNFHFMSLYLVPTDTNEPLAAYVRKSVWT